MINFNALIKRLIIPLIIGLPAACAVYYLVKSYRPDLVILPNKGVYMIGPDTNFSSYGNSDILGFEDDGKSVNLEYRLEKNYNWFPFVGVWIMLSRTKFFDLRGYDYLQVKVKDSGSGSLQFSFFNFDDRTSKQYDMLSYVIMMYECILDNAKNVYNLPLRDFHIQAWWYAHNNIHDSFSKYYDYSRIMMLEIQSGYRAPIGVKAGFTINGLTVIQDHLLLLIRIFGSLVLYSLAAVPVIIFLKRKGSSGASAVVIPYEKVPEVPLPGRVRAPNGEKERITGYIAENYMQPELSQSAMSLELGITPARIGDIIKRSFNISFKQYLNLIRITEARRLLGETGLAVSDIAFNVGFSNVTHFNRIFRASEGITPKEFRKNSSGRFNKTY